VGLCRCLRRVFFLGLWQPEEPRSPEEREARRARRRRFRAKVRHALAELLSEEAAEEGGAQGKPEA